MELKTPKTLQEAITYFSNPEHAFVSAVNLRWPDHKIKCPRCGKDEHSFIKTRLLWFCKGCKKQFTVKVGTIMEDSPIGLDKWMTAVWMTVNCKNGISSYEIHRALGVTQKSAWFMLQRIREALSGKGFGKDKIGGGDSGGGVEVDETYIGGKAKNMHKSKKLLIRKMRNATPDYLYTGTPGSLPGKTPVQGILDRETRKVRVSVVPNIKRETLQATILAQVAPGSPVFTDQAVAYDNLGAQYAHEVVNHLREYVRGRVHTNGMENFWSLLKRGLNGTYVSVEPFHLFRYVDEQVFRYNNRGSKEHPVNDATRFALAMSQISGKRLTYAELTGKGTDSLYPPSPEARPV